MRRNIWSITVGLSLVCLISIRVASGQEGTKYVAEGAVVAFNKVHRCPSCEGSKSFGTQIEHWIVRLDNWDGKKMEPPKYALVEYRSYARSLSTSEINMKLKFVLSERREHEQKVNCVGDITYKKRGKYFLRTARLSDYDLTEPGKLEALPADFKKLPCFIVDWLPLAVR